MSEKLKENMLKEMINAFVNTKAGTELEKLIVEQMLDLLHDDVVITCS